MLKWIFRLVTFYCYVALTACQANQPANLQIYLLQHPSQLRDEIAKCETSKRDPKRCDIVVAAATDMQALIQAQQRDPEGFGQRILKTQIYYSQTGKGADDIKILLAVVGLTGPE